MLQNLFQKILKECIFPLVEYQTANYPTLPLALEGLKQGREKMLSFYFKNSCTRTQMHRVGAALHARRWEATFLSQKLLAFQSSESEANLRKTIQKKMKIELAFELS